MRVLNLALGRRSALARLCPCRDVCKAFLYSEHNLHLKHSFTLHIHALAHAMWQKRSEVRNSIYDLCTFRIASTTRWFNYSKHRRRKLFKHEKIIDFSLYPRFYPCAWQQYVKLTLTDMLGDQESLFIRCCYEHECYDTGGNINTAANQIVLAAGGRIHHWP